MSKNIGSVIQLLPLHLHEVSFYLNNIYKHEEQVSKTVSMANDVIIIILVLTHFSAVFHFI